MLSPKSLITLATCAACAVQASPLQKAATPLEARNNDGGAYDVASENRPLFDFHLAMLEKNSTSGYETPMVDYLAPWLKSKGLTVELTKVENPILDPTVRRENIYAYIGKNRQCKVIVNAHTDVVPPWYPPSENATDVFGRGANDDKASIATQTFAFLALRDEGKLEEGQVCLLYNVGEERYGDGMATFVENLDWTPEAILTGEPTESYQATGHKGSINMIVNSTGETAHSSVPQYGRNAILQLFDYIPKILALEKDFPVDDFHGNTTLSLSTISGGTISNAVPAHAEALINARTGVPSKQIWDIIKSKLPENQYIDLYRSSASSNPLKMDVIKDWLPKKIMPYGTDLGGWTVKSLKFLIGPGSIATAHSDHEVVSKREMLNMLQHYKDFMTGYFNGTFTPIANGTYPSSYPLPDTSGKTKRDLAVERMQARQFTGCMH